MNKIIFIIIFLISFKSFANSDMSVRVVDVYGSAFASYEGKTHQLKKGEILKPKSEIFIEHGGRLSLSDNLDHTFYLNSDASLAIFESGHELRSGNMWVQSKNQNQKMNITTVNAHIELDMGEAILTYDTSKARTQLLVLNGMMKLSNNKTRDLSLSVTENNYSFIENNYDNGAPRDPTPVGQKTMKELMSSFIGVTPFQMNSHAHKVVTSHHVVSHEPIRAIASTPVVEHESKIIEEYKNSMLEKKLESPLPKRKKKGYSPVVHKKVDLESGPVVVQIYGQKKSSKEKMVERLPASSVVPEFSDTPVGVESKIIEVPKKDTNIPSVETNKLIDQLKNL